MGTAKLTDEDLKRIAGIKDEQMHDQFAFLIESFDALLDKRLLPLENKLSALQAEVEAIKASVPKIDHDLKALTKQTEKLQSHIDSLRNLNTTLERASQA